MAAATRLSGTDPVWIEYDRWNNALAEVVFPEREEPAPVYLDLEEDVLEGLGKHVDVPADQVEERLVAAVKPTVRRGTAGQVFHRHLVRLKQWAGSDRRTPPPVLALLAVFSLNAEHMTRTADFSQANYYGPLRRLLGFPDHDPHLEHAYRRQAETLWRALNRWLMEQDGRRGIPTAYALTHRFVGLPMSQALLRKADRERLVEFFRAFGFAPGSDLPPSDLEPVLGAWIQQNPSPASQTLQRLWSKSAARERIAQAASVALANWDGSVAEEPVGAQVVRGELRLSVALGGFPRKRFDLDVLVYAPQATESRDAVIESAEGKPRVGMTPAVPGALAVSTAAIDNGTLLEGLLRLRDTRTAVELVRRPKRLVVFRRDDLSLRNIEVEQVQLGDDITLVVEQSLLPQVERVLSTIARAGWTIHTSGYAALPERWAVITGVQIFQHPGDLVPNRLSDLNALVPLTSSSIRVAGGFTLPGSVRKWHTWSPPEIRAVSDAPHGFRVRLLGLPSGGTEASWMEGSEGTDSVEQLVDEWDDHGAGLLVVSTTELELADGDYRVELMDHGSTEPRSSVVLRLRSGDTYDQLQWRRSPELCHPDTAQEAVVSAAECRNESHVHVRGTAVVGPQALLASNGALPDRQWWSGERASSGVVRSLRIARPDPSSCIYTGRHIEVIEQVDLDRQGRPITRWTTGRCQGCGIVRRYPTSHWAARRRQQRRLATTAPVAEKNLSELPEVTESERDWETALDALIHTGGGRWALLERVALQVESSSLFVDQFGRSLEALGHVEIQRNGSDLQPTAWEVAPAVLAETCEGYFMSGCWTPELWRALITEVEEAGGRVEEEPNEDGPKSWFVIGLDAEELRRIADTLSEGFTVQERAWEALAGALPPLGQLAEALPRRSADLTGNIRWFSVPEASWVDVPDLSSSGAYRVARFSTVDIVRTPKDMCDGTIAVATVQLSKHIAALEHRPLVAYDSRSEELRVPLGADLPGLYGRAVVLASGMLPRPDLDHRMLRYRSVPRRLAAHITHLLSS